MKISVQPCSGFVLYAVLIVVVLSSMVAVSLLYATKSAVTASTAGVQGEQAWGVAMSGIYKAMRVALATEPGEQSWADNPNEFKEQLVLDDGDKWYFTVYSWNGSEDEEDALVYGLKDEAGKLNLKYMADALKTSATNSVLLQTLEGAVTESEDDLYSDLGEDILASSDASSGSGGSNTVAETELPVLVGSTDLPEFEFLDAFVTKNGYNIRALYGTDLDLNLRADAGTDDVGDVFLENVGTGSLAMGLRHQLTTASYDLNQDSLGAARINLNDTNAAIATLGLSDQTVSFIEAMRRNGKMIGSIAMLLNATETLKNEENNDQEYRVELSEEEREVVFDQCTTLSDPYLPGLININTASAEVLAVLPGLDDVAVESIISTREGLMADQLKVPTWILQQGIVSTEEFQQIYPYITTRARQFHFNVVAYAVPSGRYRVLEVIIDTAQARPQTLMIRDLTRMGMPYGIESSGESET